MLSLETLLEKSAEGPSVQKTKGRKREREREREKGKREREKKGKESTT